MCYRVDYIIHTILFQSWRAFLVVARWSGRPVANPPSGGGGGEVRCQMYCTPAKTSDNLFSILLFSGCSPSEASDLKSTLAQTLKILSSIVPFAMLPRYSERSIRTGAPVFHLVQTTIFSFSCKKNDVQRGPGEELFGPLVEYSEALEQ